MSDRGKVELLEDILYSIRRILEYTHGIGYDKFSKSKITQDAVVRNFAIIGEATKKLPVSFKAKHPEVVWSKIGRFRDKLIHHYSGVNYDVVWEIIEEFLPELLEQVERILKEHAK